jgi:hypothetical protein
MVRGVLLFLSDAFRAHERTGLTERLYMHARYVLWCIVVSLVDGFNLPMAIIPSAAGCSVASCPVDLGPGCPTQLVGPLDSIGFPVGCRSACGANLDNNPGTCLSKSPSPLPVRPRTFHIRRESQSDVWGIFF